MIKTKRYIPAIMRVKTMKPITFMAKLLRFLLSVIVGRELLTEIAMFVNLYPHATVCSGLTGNAMPTQDYCRSYPAAQ